MLDFNIPEEHEVRLVESVLLWEVASQLICLITASSATLCALSSPTRGRRMHNSFGYLSSLVGGKEKQKYKVYICMIWQRWDWESKQDLFVALVNNEHNCIQPTFFFPAYLSLACNADKHVEKSDKKVSLSKTSRILHTNWILVPTIQNMVLITCSL